MTTVTVRCAPSERSQRELQTWLEEWLKRKLISNGWSVEPVFPGVSDSRFRGDFLVRLSGRDDSVIEALLAVPEIQSAYSAPKRGAL